MKLKVERITEVGRLADQVEGADGRLLAQSLNREMSKERTAIRRSIAGATGAPYGRVAAVVRSKSASSRGLSYRIEATDEFLPLAAFGAREVRKGVSASPWKVRRVFPGAFMKGGAPGARVEASALGGQVYRRTGKARLPIVKLWGPNIPREMTREDGAPIAIWHTVVANLPARLVAEIKRRLTVGR